MAKIKAISIKIKPMKAKKQDKPAKPKPVKIAKVMDEYKHDELHSGSKKGPKVKSRKQALAIGISEARKAGEYVKPMKPKKKK